MTPLSPTSLYAVELPEGKIDIRLRKESVSWLSIIAWKNVDGKKIAKSSQVGLPDGNWQFHFTTQTATEQDWAGVVEKETDEIMIEIFGDLFMNYETEVKILNTATESGHSLLAANGLEVGRNYAILTIKK